MNNPTVSVLIPSYNHEKYVEETIKSILNQTYQDFEIIITDDGSSDDTVNVIKKFSDHRIKLLVFKENKGACKAFNNCLINSKGKYIALISSDDVWENEKLEKQVKFLDENPEIAAVFTKVKLIDENGKNITDKNHPDYFVFDKKNRSNAEWLKYFFFKGNCICHPSILIKRNIYDDIGFLNERMANLPDLDMWVRLCLKHNIHIMDEKLIKFRIRDNEANASSRTTANYIRTRYEFKKILDHYLKIDDINFFLDIFPDATKYGEPKAELMPYFLGRIAYDTKFDFMQLWGLDTIYEFMKSNKVSDILEKDYNFKYTDFLKMSSEADIHNLSKKEQLEKTRVKLNQIENNLKVSERIIKEKEKQLIHEKQTVNDLKSSFFEMRYLNNNNRFIVHRLISKFPSLYILSNIRKTGFKQALINLKGYKSIKKNHLLDINYYLKNNIDILLSGKDPILHYIYYGFGEGRRPSPSFDSNYYLEYHEDVKNSKLNPLIHYSLHGINEGRKTSAGHIVRKKSKNKKPPVLLTKKELQQKYKDIINNNKHIVDLHKFKDDTPLVSIIILNRNGVRHLKRLFKNFEENIQYPSYEIIVVDNASTDDSINFLKKLKNDLPLKIIENNENTSFSKANNQAAEISSGEYLLLLNNDVEPLYGWLNQMMQTILKSDDIGAVGAKLVYPDCSKSKFNKYNSFRVQHMGIAFKDEEGFIKPYNISSDDPLGSKNDLEKEKAAVTAAALLIKKDKYFEVNGFDEEYNYGYEDVDLCLKLLKKDYRNIYCPKSILFHYEFGTQEKNENREVKDRRLKNRSIFLKKWNQWLHKELIMDKINDQQIFSENALKVALAVTESGKNASAGDYFTALELGESLTHMGWDVSFLSKKGPDDWYDVEEDVDVLISLLDSYDIQKVISSNRSLIKVAWARNWIDRWVNRPYISKFDIIFASSHTAKKHIKEKTGIESFLLPIAANLTRFNDKIPQDEKYLSDYCFTGNYWGVPRDLTEILNPKSLPYEFKIYGKDWDKLKKLKNYHQGYIDYTQLPYVYASTKIVLDDAVNVTKEYGSVNSRVFDALACGTLVLTNGDLGAEETFEGKLPVFKSKKELNELLDYYLTDEVARAKKARELQEFVLENHTYNNRANTLKETLKHHFLKTKIAIKIPAPKWETAHEWGDYHLALGLKKEFEKKDCNVILQILPEWDHDDHCDAVIVLRGLSKYQPKEHHFNIMWNISHPDKVSIDEYNEYDYVLIASEIWAEKIKDMVNVPVEAMLQCTDPELFYEEKSNDYNHELLFVGNSRKVLRKVMKDLLPTNKDLSVYGTNWEKLIDKKYIKGEHIPNGELRRAYSSCKILLNDHWDDMREKGFISNRLFDGFASGAFIISDKIKGAGDVFGDALITYDTPDELNHLIDYYLDNENERLEKAEKGSSAVINKHTYQNRAQRFLEIIDSTKKKIKFKDNYKEFKRSIKGDNGYLFLINDSNSEIRQHFDISYTNKFKQSKFLENLNFKKKYCRSKNIEYFFFLIPDKSLVCRDFLPFEVTKIKRNYDLLNGTVPDFIENLGNVHYYKNDSHINYLGGKELAYCYLNQIDNNITREKFNALINEQISYTHLKYSGDLTWEKNCSYNDEEKKDYINEDVVTFKNKYLKDLNGNLPDEFKIVNTRKTEYYENTRGLTNTRALVLRDSSSNLIKDVFSVYFKEILLYWDHWFFNKELIQWYKPDIIIEMKTERFLENQESFLKD